MARPRRFMAINVANRTGENSIKKKNYLPRCGQEERDTTFESLPIIDYRTRSVKF